MHKMFERVRRKMSQSGALVCFLAKRMFYEPSQNRSHAKVHATIKAGKSKNLSILFCLFTPVPPDTTKDAWGITLFEKWASLFS